MDNPESTSNDLRLVWVSLESTSSDLRFVWITLSPLAVILGSCG